MPTVDEQTRLKEAGAGFLSDMAKQSTGSGGVTLTNDQLRRLARASSPTWRGRAVR